MKNYLTRPLISKPGIQRDGTPFASQSYIDGQWCRFYIGRPRKIGGYTLIDIGNIEPIRSLFAVPQSNSIDAYLGRASTIKYNHFTFSGVGSGEIDRTPDEYVVNANNVWDMDLFTTTVPTLTQFIVASAIPNGNDVSNSINGNIYYGNTDDNSHLVQIFNFQSDNLTPITSSLVLQNLNLNATYVNGTAGVGATLTNTGTLAAFVVDGVTVSINSRVLVIGQTTTFQNGIYTLTTLGTGSVAWILTRATDYDTSDKINPGDIIPIDEGTLYGGTSWVQTANVNVIGTSAIKFSEQNPVTVSGGICFSSPVMVAYGNNGFVRWSNAGDITTWDPINNIIIDNTKVIQMYRTRGGTNPQLLAWTLGSLLNLTYVPGGTAGTFSVSTVQDNITVMSQNSIIQYNQQFFWIGIDQFYFFNGIVQRLDNSMSTDWFFNNINLNARSKVWGMVIPRFKELWWFYPRNIPGQPPQTECNACVIYNTDLNVWYDSFINRASGLSTSIFPLPLMADSQESSVPSGRGIVDTFGLWMHEFEVDQNILGIKYAIDSLYETHIMTLFESNPENNRLLRTRRIEPDFKQNGNMTVTVNNRMFPSDTLENGQIIQTGPLSFTPDTQKIDTVNSQGRLVSFIFRSNEVGGNYQKGQSLVDYEIGDMKPGGNS